MIVFSSVPSVISVVEPCRDAYTTTAEPDEFSPTEPVDSLGLSGEVVTDAPFFQFHKLHNAAIPTFRAIPDQTRSPQCSQLYKSRRTLEGLTENEVEQIALAERVSTDETQLGAWRNAVNAGSICYRPISHAGRG